MENKNERMKFDMDSNKELYINSSNDIAIIGMVCRFPGVKTVDEFWEVLRDGVEVIHRDTDKYYQVNYLSDMIHVNTVIEDAEMFDANFFGFTAREAEITDPQHRLFLEGSWELMERAGYNPIDYKGLIGIYAGVSTSTYLINNILSRKDIMNSVGDLQLMIGNDKDHLTAQVAYKLNLKGPCVTVQAACSTSLVAVHLACESLLSGQCDMAIAGGITIKYPQLPGYKFQQGGLVSDDGHLRPFDGNATGTVYSNGMGIVLLKRLQDAINDGDQIYSIIKGTAVNSDGSSRVGYTAPGVDGQVAVITEAQSVAGVSPEDITYIEAHGSGTPLGDSIEIEAMIRAFSLNTDKKEFCAIGSVKANIGHTEMASGVAGLIKTALALKHKKIPPSLNYDEPNPKLGIYETPFYVNTMLTDWDTDCLPRRAGVSSFGLGGINCHVVLEEAPETEAKNNDEETEFLVLSAKTPTALKKYISNMLTYLRLNPEVNLSDLAYTMKVGRNSFPYRKAFVFKDYGHLMEMLNNCEKAIDTDVKCVSSRTAEFLFSSKPSAKWEDVMDLYNEVSEYHQIFDRLLAYIRAKYGIILIEENEKYDVLSSFVIQYTIGTLLTKWGIKIETAYVQGVGELVYLAVAGIIKAEDAIDEICLQGDKYHDLDRHKGYRKYRGSVKTEQIYDEFPFVLSDQTSLVLVGFAESINDGAYGDGPEIVDTGELLKDAKTYGIKKLIAYLWTIGINIDWNEYYDGKRHNRIIAPTYPFERKSYFIEPMANNEVAADGTFYNKCMVKEPEVKADCSGDEIISYEAVQAKLVEIWEKALGQKINNFQNSFFELGGHSLLATQVLFTVCREFKIEIPLQKFFENPTIPGFTNTLLQYLIARESRYEPLPEVETDLENRYEPFPLTDVQKAYWVGRNDKMELGNTSTHMYFENDIKQLDIERFNIAFNKMIERHEMLRAVMLPDGTQKILKEVPKYNIKVNNMANSSVEEIRRYMDTIRNEMSHQVLDCYNWPLFDVRATLLPDDCVRLHISIDLLITDAWSLELLLNELSILYHKPDYVFEKLDLSFRDYVISLNKIENTQNFVRSKEYWQKRLDTLPPGPQLQLAKDPDTIITPVFRRWKYILKKENWKKLKMKASLLGITPTVMLLSAFSEVLSTWSKSSHFTLNLTLFNRLPMHPQVNEVIGDFTSLTLLEVNYSEVEPFIKRVRANQVQLLKDMDHRYYSGVRVTRDLIAKYKDPARAIIPVIFTSLLNQVEATWEDPDNAFTSNIGNRNDDRYSISQTPQVWLDHQVIEKGGELHFNWDVVEELFPQGMIDEMFDAYCKLLHLLAESDEAWEIEFPLHYGKAEFKYRKRLDEVLAKHNNVVQISGKMLHSGFVENASKYGNAIAIETSRLRITYAQLDNCSNKIGKQLREMGVGSGQLVAVVMEKCWEQIAAVLGILKAGGAYMPVDASLPADRINNLLRIGKVKVAIVCADAAEKLVLSEDIDKIVVSEEMLNVEAEPMEMYYDPQRLAYVIFTSGSTGTPKGVMIDHQGAVNTIEDINRRFGIGRRDKVFGISSLSFDLSVYDIFGTLGAGGVLVLPDSDRLRDPSHWDMMIRERGVTVWNSVPALMNMLAEYTQGEVEYETLRLVMLSGDWIPLSLPEKIRKMGKDIEVISLGGATEASIWSILYPIKEVEEGWRSIPYGISMENQRVYVMNERLEVSPVGIVGELYIGGIGVAKGYWDDEEKTAQSFIVHPVTGERLYRTGDYGRYMEDGNIEFLGRQDTQVKIGGYRIELGEIESVIRQNEYIKDAAVVVQGDELDRKHLEAYIVVNKERLYGVEGLDDEEELITDKLERMAFKLSEPAIRKQEGNKAIYLDKFCMNYDNYYRRRSYRHFSGEPIAFKDFSGFINCLAQQKIEGVPFPKYLYASSGGVYPVQTYLQVKNNAIELLEGGFYYYDPREHRLITLSEGGSIEENIHTTVNQLIYDKAAFSIYLVGDLSAITPMYGKKKGLEYMAIEAGIITQLLESTAPNFMIGLCQIGKLEFDCLREKLKLNDNHVFLHCILGGKITENQLSKEGLIEEWNLYERNMENYESKKDYMEKDESKVTIYELIETYLKDKLPSYMVPSKIIVLDSLPLTQNGKVDRRMLTEIGRKQSVKNTRNSVSLPSNEIERKIINIWKDIFPQTEFGIRDNFFDLGGDSVSMVSVFRRLQKEISNKITMVDLFRYPTIEALAQFISSSENLLDGMKEDIIDREAERANARRTILINRAKKLTNTDS